jgi:hypothetical protein
MKGPFITIIVAFSAFTFFFPRVVSMIQNPTSHFLLENISKPKVEVLFPPNLFINWTTQNPSLLVGEGGSIKVLCIGSQPGGPVTQTVWVECLENHVVSNTSVLELDNISREDSKLYFCCRRDTKYDSSSRTCSPLYLFVELDEQADEDPVLINKNIGALIAMHVIQGRSAVVSCRPYNPSTRVILRSSTTGKMFNESGFSYSYDATVGFQIQDMKWTEDWWETECLAFDPRNSSRTDQYDVKIFWSVESRADVKEPQTWFVQKNETEYTEGDNITIECKARNEFGVHAWLQWAFDHDLQEFEDRVKQSKIRYINSETRIESVLKEEKTSTVTILRATKEDEGVYSCQLVSMDGKVFPSVNKTISVSRQNEMPSGNQLHIHKIEAPLPPKEHLVHGDRKRVKSEIQVIFTPLFFLVLGICCSVILVISGAIILYIRRQREYNCNRDGSVLPVSIGKVIRNPMFKFMPSSNSKSRSSTLRSLEGKIIKASQLQFYDQGILGSGAFGDVVKATFRDPRTDTKFDVAVKRMRKMDNNILDSSLLHELQILSSLDFKHENIVNLIGAVFDPELMLVEEYCRLGNLADYLMKHRNSFIAYDRDGSNDFTERIYTRALSSVNSGYQVPFSARNASTKETSPLQHVSYMDYL